MPETGWAFTQGVTRDSQTMATQQGRNPAEGLLGVSLAHSLPTSRGIDSWHRCLLLSSGSGARTRDWNLIRELLYQLRYAALTLTLYGLVSLGTW